MKLQTNTKKSDTIISRILRGEALMPNEALMLYKLLPTPDLMALAHTLRQQIKPGNTVSWIIDRNVNISNVCASGCAFCSFYCHKADNSKAFETSIEEYKIKIEELFAVGGKQLLLQGGLNPSHRLSYYENLFQTLKQMFPALKLHALGPPEIYFLAQMEKIPVHKVLERLVKAGLDSLPGAGAEILADRVRRIVSPNKCTANQWLKVMHEAHKMNITTTATMMFGHVETPAERISHIFKIKNTQSFKPAGAHGFIAFIPWTFQSPNTELIKRFPNISKTTPDTYLRTVAISRIILTNVPNIQASWLTTGKETARLALYAGANDLGSVMLEENVVAASGVTNKLSPHEMQELIRSAGFKPVMRDQKYNYISSV